MWTPDGPVARLLRPGPDGRQTAAQRMLARAWSLGARVQPPAGAPALAGDGSADWTLILAPGETPAPHALAVLRHAAAAAPHAAAIYTDTVRVDPAGSLLAVELKPAHDPVLAAARPYAGGLRIERRGAPVGPVLHLPYPGAISAAPAPLPRPPPPFAGPFPRISVVIPSRDRPDLIGTVLAGLREATDYPAFEIIVVDNGTTDPGTLALYRRETARGGFRALVRPEPFNFSAMVNRGIAAAEGEAVLLLNNDIAVTEPGWLREMAACLALPGTGIVGARLLFPDGTLQHAGVVLGLGGGLAGHWHAGALPGARPDAPDPLGRLAARGRFSAVTAAAMLISRPCLAAAGPFDETAFAVAFNDVDFCLRAGRAGFASVWTPFATLTHAESQMRRRRSPGAILRHLAECRALRARHGAAIADDPAFNPWLSRDTLRPVPRRLSRLPGLRAFGGTAHA